MVVHTGHIGTTDSKQLGITGRFERTEEFAAAI